MRPRLNPFSLLHRRSCEVTYTAKPLLPDLPFLIFLTAGKQNQAAGGKVNHPIQREGVARPRQRIEQLAMRVSRPCRQRRAGLRRKRSPPTFRSATTLRRTLQAARGEPGGQGHNMTQHCAAVPVAPIQSRIPELRFCVPPLANSGRCSASVALRFSARPGPPPPCKDAGDPCWVSLLSGHRDLCDKDLKHRNVCDKFLCFVFLSTDFYAVQGRAVTRPLLWSSWPGAAKRFVFLMLYMLPRWSSYVHSETGACRTNGIYHAILSGGDQDGETDIN